MADIVCQVQKILDPQDPVLTVGERFVLSCHGSIPELDKKTAQLQTNDQDRYKLKVLRWEKTSADAFRIEVVSDQVGKHDLKNVTIKDATTSLVIPDVQFEVRTVQDPQKPIQEPYGLQGPLSLYVPPIYWMGLLAVIAVVGALIAWRISRRLKRRGLMRQILNEASAQTPEAELYQSLRKFQRSSEFLLHPEALVPAAEAEPATHVLNEAYRLYISRLFELPASRWPTSKTLKTLRREHSGLSTPAFEGTRRILRELDRSMQVPLHAKDFLQIVEWIRDNAALLEIEKRRGA